MENRHCHIINRHKKADSLYPEIGYFRYHQIGYRYMDSQTKTPRIPFKIVKHGGSEGDMNETNEPCISRKTTRFRPYFRIKKEGRRRRRISEERKEEEEKETRDQ